MISFSLLRFFPKVSASARCSDDRHSRRQAERGNMRSSVRRRQELCAIISRVRGRFFLPLSGHSEAFLRADSPANYATDEWRTRAPAVGTNSTETTRNIEAASLSLPSRTDASMARGRMEIECVLVYEAFHYESSYTTRRFYGMRTST